jgi:cobalt-zinc-cadmium efflux system membrane fusion protein
MKAEAPSWLILIALTVAVVSTSCERTEAPVNSHAEHRQETVHEHGEATGESSAHTHDEHGIRDDHGDDSDHAGGAIRLRAGQLERLGATIASVGAGIIDEGIELLGEIHPNGDQLAHITPRFAGLVVDVRKTVGDHAKTGDVLAVIESSESLAPYELKSLIDGTIIDKHLTRGEAVDRDRVCFVVADLSSVWVDLSVYQKDFDHIQPGQPVRIRADHGHLGAEGTIGYVTPAIDPRTRTATARAVLPNPNGTWRPGMFVTALVLQPGHADITIPATAIQTIEGQATAFALTDDGVEARPLSLGRRGETTVEVLAGLVPGDRVVATNSFLLKAELGKSEAEHQH